MAEWTKVASADDCPAGTVLGCEADGERVCVMNVDGEYHAVEDECSHQEFPLSDGELVDGEIECMYHGARFDVKTGDATQLPAIKGVKKYEVECRDGELYVRVDG